MRPSTRMVALGRRLWTPTSLGSSLALWLDAGDASTITLDGNTVSEWRDKSGNGRHAVQTTKANQPTYLSNGLIDWDGVNDSMVISGGTIPLHTILSGNNSHSVTIILQPDNISNLPLFLHVPFSGSWQFLIESNNAGLYWASDSSGLRTYSNGFFTQNTLSFFTVNKTGATTGEAYSNGTLQQSFSGNLTTTPTLTSPFLIGSFVNATYNYDGKFAGIIITREALSALNRQNLEGFLAHSLSSQSLLPSNHPFRFTPPLA